MNIDLNSNKKELFNDLIYDLQDAKTRFVINYGGAGSGKSYTQTQHEIIKCLQGYEKVMVTRKVASTLKDSVISLFTSIIDDWGLSTIYDENKATQFITFKNNSQILFKGLDNSDKIKSINGLTRIWNEEASELTKSDFNQLNLRLRGRPNLQMTSTFNPIDEDHWIKAHFFDTPEIRAKTTIIQTTYLNNKFIDEAYKEELEGYKLIDPNYYKVYTLGQWGGLTEGRIFQTWEEIDEFPQIDGYWYGLDFGYSNDPTAIVKVIKAADRIYLDEICYRTGLTNSDIAGLMKSEGYTGEMVICDSAEPKSVEELRRFGINAIGADKGKGSIMAGIDLLKRTKVVITRRSSNIRKENRYYQWKTKKDGSYERMPKDFQNHQIDAIRYALSYNFQQVGKKESYLISY